MRKLKQPLPEMISQATIFEAGKNRPVHVILHPDRIYLRARGCKQWHVLKLSTAMLHAIGVEAGFDPSPVRRLVRGGVS